MRLTGFLACSALVCAFAALPASAQQAPFQSPNMTFFISGSPGPDGANFGGIEGADKHCQDLAATVGAGGKTWRAYLSQQAMDGKPAINARDRIGKGPWVNALGLQIASSVEALHDANRNSITVETGVSEQGRRIPTRSMVVNFHDILTGTLVDGTAPPAGQGHDLRQLDEEQRRLRHGGPFRSRRHAQRRRLVERGASFGWLQPPLAGPHGRQRSAVLLRRELS